MSDALLDIPGYWINLDRSAERRTSFHEHTGKYWRGKLTRVSAVDGRTDFTPEQVLEWTKRRLTRGTDKTPKERYSDRTLRHSAATWGGLNSHIKALKQGIADGHEKFVVMEDDAAYRPALAALTDEPPEDAWVASYGGVPMLGLKADDQSFVNKLAKERPNEWRLLKSNGHFYGTHCHVITRDAAAKLIPIYEADCCAADIAWHALFDLGPCYRLQVQLVTQASGVTSDITGKLRTGTTTNV